jgi:hypothetical protein
MKKTLKETRRQGWLTLLALSVIAITVYIGFAPLFSLVGGGVAGAVIGSSFGAIFVIILTMYLLNKQTEIEQETKKSERVFDEKVRLYQQILDIARDILIDGNLSEEEINRLPFPVIRLQMLGADETIAAFQKVFAKLNAVYAETDGDSINISENDRNEIFQMLSSFAGVCRKDLGISDKDVSEKISKETNQAIANSGKKERDYTKYSFDGKKLAKNRYVWNVISNFINENPGMTLNEFEKVINRVPSELAEKKEGIWKTYDEAIELFVSKGSKHKRHFITDTKDVLSGKELVLKLKDEEICITNQWNLRQITCFVEMIKQKGIRYE